jgi:RNA recognition motif-containing protein
MLIFIRVLPESVTRDDLYQFASRAVRSPWSRMFGQRGRIKGVDILKITDQERGSVAYHGLVDIEPAKSAMIAIKRLDGSEINGKRVLVRKYYTRSRYRDRRGQMPQPAALTILNRRLKDRRRPQLSKEMVHVSGGQSIHRSGEGAGEQPRVA